MNIDKTDETISLFYCQIKRIGNLYGEDRGTGFAGNVWDKNYISPTLTTMSGGNREPMILVKR